MRLRGPPPRDREADTANQVRPAVPVRKRGEIVEGENRMDERKLGMKSSDSCRHGHYKRPTWWLLGFLRAWRCVSCGVVRQ